MMSVCLIYKLIIFRSRDSYEDPRFLLVVKEKLRTLSLSLGDLIGQNFIKTQFVSNKNKQKQFQNSKTSKLQRCSQSQMVFDL